MSNIIPVNSNTIIRQLRHHLKMMERFDGYVRETIEGFVDYNTTELSSDIISSLNFNKHVRELYRGKIVAILEILNMYDESREDISDIESLRRKIGIIEYFHSGSTEEESK